jgi:hypothetical protein
MAQMNLRSPVAGIVLWASSIACVSVLVIVRYRAALAGGIGMDLRLFFLPAARAVANGASPYDTPGYVYSPHVALLLAPIADNSIMLPLWIGCQLAFSLAAIVALTAALWRDL